MITGSIFVHAHCKDERLDCVATPISPRNPRKRWHCRYPRARGVQWVGARERAKDCARVLPRFECAPRIVTINVHASAKRSGC